MIQSEMDRLVHEVWRNVTSLWKTSLVLLDTYLGDLNATGNFIGPDYLAIREQQDLNIWACFGHIQAY